MRGEREVITEKCLPAFLSFHCANLSCVPQLPIEVQQTKLGCSYAYLDSRRQNFLKKSYPNDKRLKVDSYPTLESLINNWISK